MPSTVAPACTRIPPERTNPNPGASAVSVSVPSGTLSWVNRPVCVSQRSQPVATARRALHVAIAFHSGNVDARFGRWRAGRRGHHDTRNRTGSCHDDVRVARAALDSCQRGFGVTFL